jgi:hypothetical protein
MRVSNSLPMFFSINDVELTKMIASISKGLNYKGPQEDIKNDLFVRMKVLCVLERYDPNRAKISTLLYRIIKNLILKYIMEERKNKFYVLPDDFPDDMHEVDLAVQFEGLDVDYASMVERNADSDIMGSKATELKEFIAYLRNTNKNISQL